MLSLPLQAFQLSFALVVAYLCVSVTYAKQTPVIVEGDIFIHTGDQDSQRLHARSIGLAENSQLWPAGIIPYTIDPSLPAASVSAIKEAIDYWNEFGAISLLPLSDVQRNSNSIVKDLVRFVEGEFCASWVGRRGGEQDVWIAPHCRAGSVMHEIGHLIGLEHEHTRPDRDQYINIHWDNIIEDKLHNFDVAPEGSQMLGTYDYASIMHYGPANFSRNGLATISSVDGVAREIGQRIAPSEGDLQVAELLYASNLSLSVSTTQQRPSMSLDVYLSNKSDQGAHGVSVKVETDTIFDSTHVPIADNWTCRLEGIGSAVRCSLASLTGSAVEHLVVPLPLNVNLEAIIVSVSSKTPDTDPSDNSSKVDVRSPGPDPVQPLGVLPMSDAQMLESALQQDAVANMPTNGGSIDAVLFFLLLLISRCRAHKCSLYASRYCPTGRPVFGSTSASSASMGGT